MRQNEHDALEDLELSLRARRGELLADEQQTLEHALERSALLRVAHATGRSFDAASVVRAGDDELVSRAAAQALLPRTGRHRRGGVRLLLGVAAALLFGTAAAAAIVAVQQGRGLELRQKPPAGAPARPTETAKKRPPMNEAPPASAPVAEPSLVAANGDPVLARGPIERAPSSAARPPSSGTSAADLFRTASAARRAGDFGSARALYSELQARFPGTNEARVSQVSLGKLLLAAGQAHEAERAFAAYLRDGGGDLTEEALVGRANALQALGHDAAERRAWQELLRRYPTSVYRTRAEARSATLDAARDAASK